MPDYSPHKITVIRQHDAEEIAFSRLLLVWILLLYHDHGNVIVLSIKLSAHSIASALGMCRTVVTQLIIDSPMDM